MSEDKMVQATSEPGPSDVRSPFQFGTWYPIETAPKDGRSLLLVDVTSHTYFSAHWNGGTWECCETGDTAYRGFTHWMPLPHPPIEEKGE